MLNALCGVREECKVVFCSGFFSGFCLLGFVSFFFA